VVAWGKVVLHTTGVGWVRSSCVVGGQPRLPLKEDKRELGEPSE